MVIMKYKFTAKYKGQSGIDPWDFTIGEVYRIEIEADKDYISILAKESHNGIARKKEYINSFWSEFQEDWEFQFKSLIEEVLLERVRQDHKFGKRDQHSMRWAVILGEEVGEVSREICDSNFEWTPSENYRKELIEVAAVALAAIQNYDYSKREEDKNIQQALGADNK